MPRVESFPTIFLHQSNDLDYFILFYFCLLNIKYKTAPFIIYLKISRTSFCKNKISISSSLVLKWSVFLLFVELDLGNCLSLFLQLLALFQVTFSHLFQVLFEKHLSLLAVFSLFALLKDVLDMFFKLIRMANINELQCVFNCNAPSSSDIIH